MNAKEYVEAINQTYQTGGHVAREHSYRGVLQQFIESLGVIAINEAQHIDCGAPDFTIYNKSENVIGFIETKDIDDPDLDGRKKNKEQFTRYKNALGNLLFTDYLDFHFYNGAEFVDAVNIGRLVGDKIVFVPENEEKFLSNIKKFVGAKPQKITSTIQLANLLAQKAKLIKQSILDVLTANSDESTTFRIHIGIFKQVLIHDLDDKKFADIYAQTITYGIFVARMHDNTPETFSREEAIRLLPSTNPFLKEMFELMVGSKMCKSIEWIVNDLVAVLGVSDLRKVLREYGARQDVVLHFYEDFLSVYDPELKTKQGVFYTPKPVVNFIVRAVDHILQADFCLSEGIANSDKIVTDKKTILNGKNLSEKVEAYKVQILDPALGTGTFLAEVIEQVYAKYANRKAAWQSYVDDCLLERLNGFEYMMAPHTMAHIKLGNLLEETGWKNTDGRKRLNVYLTNSLEKGTISDQQLSLFEESIARESEMANRIKTNCPVMCVIGNPPYRGKSTNRDNWIMDIIANYKYEPDRKKTLKLQEQNPKWINDDYVKFIGLAENYVANNKTGIVGYINNNSFLDNVTFRGMRWHLLETFDKIYIINLHGCNMTGGVDVCPDGSPDDNVFNIKVGVSINLFVKTGEKKKNELGKVYYCDLYGSRASKFDWLNNHELENVNFEEVELTAPYYFFTPKQKDGKKKYDKGFLFTDIMPLHITGMVSGGNKFAIAHSKEELKARLMQVKNGEISKSELIEKYALGDKYADNIISNLKLLTISDELFVPISFRQFDEQITYYSNKVLERPRIKILSNMLKNNIAIIVCRQCKEDWKHVFVTDKIADLNITGTAGSFGSGYVFPLYVYNRNECNVNLNLEITSQIEDAIGCKVRPQEIFDYIYGVFHSPKYRKLFNEFLKTDFPRIPYPKNAAMFSHFAGYGGKLRQLHLMQNVKPNPELAIMNTIGSNEVLEYEYNQGRVYINKEQYFENVPEEAWNFHIGGYQTAQDWLKDRSEEGVILGWKEIEHFQKIITVLMETKRIMDEIDQKDYFD